jgi:hypothetical protein
MIHPCFAPDVTVYSACAKDFMNSSGVWVHTGSIAHFPRIQSMRSKQQLMKFFWLFCAVFFIAGGNILNISQAVAAPGFYDATAAQIAQPPGTLIRREPIALPAFYRARAWRILYATRDYAGRPVAASGIVVASTVGVTANTKQSIVAWAHPTVGTAVNCAPSARKSPAGFIPGLNELVAAGHVVVATDYAGLGTPGPLGYLVGTGQAYAVLDSVRAAARMPGVNVSPDYAVYGFSQGGHAAAFVGLLAAQYMPEFRLKALAAIAPPTNLPALFAANIGSIEGKILMSYTMKSWAVKYGLNMREVLSNSALATTFAINAICVDDAQGAIDAYTAQTNFGPDMFVGSPLQHPDWRKVMIENTVSIFPLDVPMMLVQGGFDSIVRPEVTARVYKDSCQSGASINLLYLKDATHSGSEKKGIPPVVAWLNAILRGQANKSSCPQSGRV